jgi:hypothetical protein
MLRNTSRLWGRKSGFAVHVFPKPMRNGTFHNEIKQFCQSSTRTPCEKKLVRAVAPPRRELPLAGADPAALAGVMKKRDSGLAG